MADDQKSDMRKGLEKLEAMGFDELSEEDLEDVAGGAATCSYWCCSDGGEPGPAEVEEDAGETAS